jgi:beta-lactam-binding protein with PASTA domain
MTRWFALILVMSASIARANPPSRAVVPQVFNLTEADAESALRRAGFPKVTFLRGSSCGSVVRRVVIEKGRVCHQTPAAGQHAARGLSVAIRIQPEDPWRGETKEGRAWFLAPELVGWTVETAREKLAERGHEGTVKVRFDGSCTRGVVCRQHPPGLQRAGVAATIMLVAGPP